jgi:tRNA-splicing ligase RtcB (3'-phosphate/5'-hydroxy nucleic acid ligase)
MQQVSKRLFSWASILEPTAREQAERAASMPFIFPHLALMPDAHAGKGSTVGSVIPTLGAIMPAAVGVDIGCFRGDTRVPLLNGTQRSLKELAGGIGPYQVYSLDGDKQIVPGHAIAMKTRSNAQLMKVIVSGGEEIVCTPDHLFMMNDGTYLEARDLRFNDSLMPLYRNLNVDPEMYAIAGNDQLGAPYPVIAVELLSERSDVYCLQVEDHHNFALAAGVFVHNCGMIATRTQFTAENIRRRGGLVSLREAIEETIPLSAGKYNDVIFGAGTAERIAVLDETEGAASADAIAPNWRFQLGSLGSGNHFIEVSLDELDRVWLFLHSGSRGVGNRLASKHIKMARHLCERWWVPLPDPDLAYLVEGTDEFWAYIRDLRWAQKFALLNRAEMMYRVVECLAGWIGTEVAEEEVIECHHNYTESEVHWGKQVWLSRKGAIDASKGKPGLIPGSMGTASYIVTGLGNRLALNSAPHGAGRGYSRAAARKAFTRAQLDAAMEGIEWGRSDAFLDEIPGAYKPVEQVMRDAVDLVKVEHVLRQIVNVKGD